MKNVVIAGAGQAAIWAIKTLRSEGYQGSITVIGEESESFYERPPLSKAMLTQEPDYNSLKIFSDEAVDELDITLIKPVRVEKIDRVNKKVITNNNQELPYDKLLIATGSKAKIPVSEWENIPNVFSLRNIEDSKKIREKIESAKNIAIIGGGWIGLEVAASLKSLGLNVTLYELSNRLCSRSITNEVSDYLLNLHKQQGITINLACGGIEIESDAHDQSVKIKTKESATRYEAVLLGTGAHINKEIAAESGIEVADAIVVDKYCQTSDPNIFAAGDVAIHPDLGFSIQSWANAQNQGVIAAKSILSMNEAYEDTPWLWSDQYDKNIQILGSSLKIEECRLVIREEPNGSVCFFYLNSENKLQYVVAVNNNKAIKIAKRWMKSNLTLDPELLQDPNVNILKIK